MKLQLLLMLLQLQWLIWNFLIRQEHKGFKSYKEGEVVSNDEKNENTGFESFYATIVTQENFESYNVALVTSDVTLVTVVSLESSVVTLVSQDNNINEAHHIKKDENDINFTPGF